ncbi:MAG: D-sedoheptulose-7-phosphate isomerase [Phycisphaerae bacterium]
MKDEIRKRFEEHLSVMRLAGEHLTGPIAQAVELLTAALRNDRGVLVFGNGGSAADAQHVACELVGRFLTERKALRAMALTTDTSILTAVANDYGFERVFSRQVEAHGREGDVAIGISTSGHSPSVVLGLETARKLGLSTIAMTGTGGGKCAELADVLLDVPARLTPRVQEAHSVICHIICEFVERAFSEKE